MVDGSGKPDERDSSSVQIRTLLEEQRQMIIAEYREKVGHHELHAAHAEEERRLLREELWRQKLEFRETHQQSLTEMEELRKFQSSTFDTIARRKLIEDQNTILELSGRVQELQNEVNCMNDSKDFQDAESVRSGNSHVTSRPVSFPPHPIPEGMLRHSFGRAAKHLGHTWYIGKRFCKSTCIFISTYPELCERHSRARLVVLAAEVGGRWSDEAADFLEQLAKAKARGVPRVLQVRTRQAWQMRWSYLLACSSARAFALSLLDRRAVVGVDGDTPSSSDVVGDIRHVPLSGFA